MSCSWIEMLLGDFIELKRGYDLPKSKRLKGEKPIISSAGFSDYHSESKVASPGVVTGRYGTIGEVFYIEEDFWPLNTTLYVKNFKGNCPEFVYYLLKTFDFHKYSDKAAVPGVNRNHLHMEKIYVPSDYIWQERIASYISTFDKKIKLNTQTNQTLEEMAQAIFKSWFVDFDPVRAKMRGEQPEGMDEATAALFPDKLVDSELGPIPECWSVEKIGDVVERFSVGKKYNQKIAVESGSVPILDQGKSGIIGYHNDKPGVKASLNDPIIVFANHTCYMKLVTYNFSAIQNVLPFKLKDCDIYWSYLATKGKQNFIEYKGHWPDFMVHEIVIPVEELMQRFGKVVKPFYSQIASNEKQNKNLAKIRDTLLPKLLSGEIRIAGVEDVAAEA